LQYASNSSVIILRNLSLASTGTYIKFSESIAVSITVVPDITTRVKDIATYIVSTVAEIASTVTDIGITVTYIASSGTDFSVQFHTNDCIVTHIANKLQILPVTGR
jgi:hypothetical protein